MRLIGGLPASHDRTGALGIGFEETLHRAIVKGDTPRMLLDAFIERRGNGQKFIISIAKRHAFACRGCDKTNRNF